MVREEGKVEEVEEKGKSGKVGGKEGHKESEGKLTPPGVLG